MIPGKIVRFLDQSASVAFVGTRDGNLVPFGHRVSGWRLGAEQRTMTIFLPDDFTGTVVDLLRQNGELAVTIEAFPVHETYQFKGRYLRHRAPLPDDIEAVDRIRQRFVRNMRTVPFGPPEDALKAGVRAVVAGLGCGTLAT